MQILITALNEGDTIEGNLRILLYLDGSFGRAFSGGDIWVCQPLKNPGKRILSNMDTKDKDTEVRKGLMYPRSKDECRKEKGLW